MYYQNISKVEGEKVIEGHQFSFLLVFFPLWNFVCVYKRLMGIGSIKRRNESVLRGTGVFLLTLYYVRL